MAEDMNVLDAMQLARTAAASAIRHMPMTLGAIEFLDLEAPVRQVIFTVEFLGSRKNYPVSIVIEVDDGRTSESVESLKVRLLEQVRTTVGDRVK